MPRLTTYGFEAEFATNAARVIERLHSLGCAGDGTLHGYHCDCEYCQFRNGHAFRGQTDSSCSGEIISDVFGLPDEEYADWNDEDAYEAYRPADLMARLCAASVEVDAEPGLNSGFHVHVGIQDLNSEPLRNALWQFIRWEPILTRIGGGRWQEQRAGMNTTVRQCTRYEFENWQGAYYSESRIRDAELSNDFLNAILTTQQCADRHSNLNVSARRSPTWEFRLWNSTRSAWRMEMFCGLSVALLDPDVVTALSLLQPPIRRHSPSSGVFDVAGAVAAGGHDATAELVNRQARYLDERAAQAPTVLTLV